LGQIPFAELLSAKNVKMMTLLSDSAERLPGGCSGGGLTETASNGTIVTTCAIVRSPTRVRGRFFLTG